MIRMAEPHRSAPAPHISRWRWRLLALALAVVAGAFAAAVLVGPPVTAQDSPHSLPAWEDFGPRSLAVGAAHACLITAAQSVACWGRNDDGETEPPPGLRAADLSLGEGYSCARPSPDSTVRAARSGWFCWGSRSDLEPDTTNPNRWWLPELIGPEHRCGWAPPDGLAASEPWVYSPDPSAAATGESGQPRLHCQGEVEHWRGLLDRGPGTLAVGGDDTCISRDRSLNQYWLDVVELVCARTSEDRSILGVAANRTGICRLRWTGRHYAGCDSAWNLSDGWYLWSHPLASFTCVLVKQRVDASSFRHQPRIDCWGNDDHGQLDVPEWAAVFTDAQLGLFSSPSTEFTTTLYPGWNLIGDAGEVSQLFDELPRLEQVRLWRVTCEHQGFHTMTRDDEIELGESCQDAYLYEAFSVARWLLISPGPPVQWRRTSGGLRRPVTPFRFRGNGWDARAWADSNSERGAYASCASDCTVAELLWDSGGVVESLWIWDAAGQQWRAHFPGGPEWLGNLKADDIVSYGSAFAYRLRDQLPGGYRLPGFVSGEHPPGGVPVAFTRSSAVTATQLADVRNTFDRIMNFFEQRWGIKPQGDLRIRVGRTDSPRGACGSGGSSSIGYSLGCGETPGIHHLLAHEYLHVLQDRLGPSTGWVGNIWADIAPRWVSEGSAEYVESLYESAAGGRSYASLRSGNWWAARQSGTALQDAEENCCSGPYYPSYTLGFVAIEWLVHRFGEQAVLFDLWRALRYDRWWAAGRDHDSPGENRLARAFQVTFGIELDDFYAEFEDYLRGSIPAFTPPQARVVAPS